MSRKRPAEHQLTRDSVDEDLEEAQPEEIQKATPAELSKRKILRIKKPNQPTTTGGLFSGIAVGGLAANTANKPPAAAAGAGGFGGFSFQPMAPISMKPVAATKAEEPAAAAPAAADPVQFNFAAPTSFGAKFDPPTTSDKVSFPPLTSGAKFDSLASAFQPPSSSPTSTPPVLTPFATAENEMAKLAAEAKDVASSPSESPTGDAAVGSPAGSSSKKPEVFAPANVRQEVAPVLDTKVEAASDKSAAEKPAVALQGVTLREAKEDKTGWTERGTGSVHLTERGADGSKPRLLMWREQTHQLILNAAIDDTFRLASQELKLKSAFAFVWFNPETNKPLTYSLKVKKSDSIELLFNGIKAAQAGSQ